MVWNKWCDFCLKPWQWLQSGSVFPFPPTPWQWLQPLLLYLCLLQLLLLSKPLHQNYPQNAGIKIVQLWFQFLSPPQRATIHCEKKVPLKRHFLTKKVQSDSLAGPQNVSSNCWGNLLPVDKSAQVENWNPYQFLERYSHLGRNVFQLSDWLRRWQ